MATKRVSKAERAERGVVQVATGRKAWAPSETARGEPRVFRCDRMKARRQELKMKVANLAHLANITVAQVYGFERGGRDPSCIVLRRICIALHCSSDYLIDLADKP